MTSNNSPMERLVETLEDFFDEIAERVSDLDGTLGTALQRIPELERENAALKASLEERERMTKKRAENTPLEVIIEHVENDADAVSEALILFSATADRLGTRAKELQQENAALKASLHEALELLQRCYDALDATEGHIDVQEDIDALIHALRADAEEEGVPRERRYTARELMALPRAQRNAILRKAADKAAAMRLYSPGWFANEAVPNVEEEDEEENEEEDDAQE